MRNPVNFRDLGGIKTKDGYKIKEKRLLRSGSLMGLTEDERKALLEEYGLKCIIDFRTGVEAVRHPDIALPGVSYKNLDVMRDSEGKVATTEHFQMMQATEEARDFMFEAYSAMVDTNSAKAGFETFLREAIDQEEGALLFHCSAGKDRTGYAAALLLTLLDVSRDDIMEDYLLTNEMRKEKNEEILTEAKTEGASPEMLDVLKIIFSVDEAYLDHVFEEINKTYGSFSRYVKKALHLQQIDIDLLRQNYLTKQ